MGSRMRLVDIVKKIHEFDRTHTIYAAKPWHADSLAVVEYEPDDGSIPPIASGLNLLYFLEIEIARDVLEGWNLNIEGTPSDHEMCQRLVKYARDDA
jgi:hypothetical protein